MTVLSLLALSFAKLVAGLRGSAGSENVIQIYGNSQPMQFMVAYIAAESGKIYKQ